MNVINYHVTKYCNYNCNYCFGIFPDESDLPLDRAKKVVDNVYRYMQKSGHKRGRLNLAGGEPLLYSRLDELIDHISSKGLEVSLITNASLLTKERIYRWKGKVSCVGVSVDSALESVNLSIGRRQSGRVLTKSQLLDIASAIHQCEIKLKVNTVVSKYNCDEDMRGLYADIKPDRLKFLQMQIVDGINSHAKESVATQSEFCSFCQRHKDCSPNIVIEPLGSMQNAYLIVSPGGNICLNDNGEFKVYGNCLRDEFFDTLKSMPTDAQKFNARYKEAI